MENKDLELLISLYVDGELSERMTANVSRMIETDSAAAALYADFLDIKSGIRSLPRLKLPPDFSKSVLNRLRENSTQSNRQRFRVHFIHKKTVYLLSVTAASLLVILVPAFLFLGSGDQPQQIAVKRMEQTPVQKIAPPDRPLADAQIVEKDFNTLMAIRCVVLPDKTNAFKQQLQYLGSQLTVKFASKIENNKTVYEYTITRQNFNALINLLDNGQINEPLLGKDPGQLKHLTDIKNMISLLVISDAVKKWQTEQKISDQNLSDANNSNNSQNNNVKEIKIILD